MRDMRCIAGASRGTTSEGACGPSIVVTNAPRPKGAASKGGDRRKVAERRRTSARRVRGGDGGGGGGREGGPSQATASRHNSELPRCEGRIDSIALTLYASALCIYVNA